MKKFKAGERVIEDVTLYGYFCWVKWDGLGYRSWEPEHHLKMRKPCFREAKLKSR